MNFINTNTNEYPIHVWQFQNLFPNVDPNSVPDSGYAGYCPVYPSDVPTNNATGAWADGAPTFNSQLQRWESTWTLVPYSSDELAGRLELLKESKKQKLAEHRFNIETKSISVNGILIRTDRESQSQLQCTVAAIQQGFSSTISWKGENGWLDLDASQISALVPIVIYYVQTCFANERAICLLIDAATSAEELDAISFDTGWPESVYTI